MLFKLHGSVDWGHVTRCGLTDREFRDPLAVEQKIISLIDSTGTTIYDDRFEMKSAASNLMDNGLVLSPAIAIPVKNKDSFECPKSHLNTLARVIPEIDKLLVVGWRAQEEHFLRYLKTLSKEVRVLVVAGDTADVKQTGDTLRAAGAEGTYTDIKQGFSYLVQNDEVIDKLLWD